MLHVVRKAEVREAQRQGVTGTLGNLDCTAVIPPRHPMLRQRAAQQADPHAAIRGPEGITRFLRVVQDAEGGQSQTFGIGKEVDPSHRLARSNDLFNMRGGFGAEEDRGQPVAGLPQRVAQHRQSNSRAGAWEGTIEVIERALQMLASFDVLAAAKQRLSHLPLEHPTLGALPRLASAFARGECFAIQRERLGISGDPDCLVARLDQVLASFRPLTRVRELKGEHAEEVVETVRVLPLDRRRDQSMEVTALLQEDGLIGDVVYQRVLEDVLEFRHASALPNEAGGVELAEGLIDGTQVRENGAQESISKAAADHRGHPQYLARIVLESVDAGTDQAAERVGNCHLMELFRRAPAPLRLIPLHCADIDEHRDELLDEERIPIGLPEDQGTQIGCELGRAEHARGHLGRVVLIKWFERDLHEALRMVPPDDVKQTCCR